MDQDGPNPTTVLSLEKGEGDSVRDTERSCHAKTEAQGVKQGKEFRDCCQPPDPRTRRPQLWQNLCGVNPACVALWQQPQETNPGGHTITCVVPMRKGDLGVRSRG